MDKTYNHINWDLLLYMPERCGFGTKWRTWIYYCISTTHFFVLVNGMPKDFFKSSQGLRQNDLLSMLLFVFVTRDFTKMILRVVEGGSISEFFVGEAHMSLIYISYLLFAKDSLIYCEANLDQIRILKALLLCFEAISSLKVKLVKSKIIPIGDVNNVERLDDTLGCKILYSYLIYLMHYLSYIFC